MDSFQSIEKEGFKTLTDPDVLAKMAKNWNRSIINPYVTYSTFAEDLIWYPEQGLKKLFKKLKIGLVLKLMFIYNKEQINYLLL